MAEIRYNIKPIYTGALAALSLATTLLKKSKTNTWAELTTALADPESDATTALKAVVLSDEQVTILDRNEEVLQYLKVNPPVHVALCQCGLPYLVSGGAAPTKCLADPTCKGVPVKPSFATMDKPAAKKKAAAGEATE